MLASTGICCSIHVYAGWRGISVVRAKKIRSIMETFVLTVTGGVIIFSAGQILLKLIIEPAQDLKRALGATSHTLLSHHSKLTNASSDKDVAIEIKLRSAEILSKSCVILMYGLVRSIFGLPSKQNLLDASRHLNRIYYGMLQESKDFENSPSYNAARTDFATENSKAMSEVGRLLNIVSSYEKL
jgi:hypothetical protein